MTETVQNWEVVTLAKLDDWDISAQDLWSFFKVSFNWPILDSFLKRMVLEMVFEEHELTAADDELEEFVDNFRSNKGLLTAKETEAWLKSQWMDTDDLYDACEFMVKAEKLKKLLFDEDFVSGQFALNRDKFESVEYYQICVKGKEKALELASLLKEGESFFELARKYNDDDTAKTCGYGGVNVRSNLRPELESKIFASEVGDIVGPIKSLGLHYLIMIEKFYPAELDDASKEQIREEHFEKWLLQKFHNCSLELLIN